MKLKHLDKDAVYLICQLLDTQDLLSFYTCRDLVSHLTNFKFIFTQCAKRYGIYDASFKKLDAENIKNRIEIHMEALYKEVRSVCSKRVAPDIFPMMLEDDAGELVDRLRQDATSSARALMPVAIRFSRLQVMHSLLNHFHVGSRHIWLMHAIREEQYDAVKYLIEIVKVPLISSQQGHMLPSGAYSQKSDATASTVPSYKACAILQTYDPSANWGHSCTFALFCLIVSKYPRYFFKFALIINQ